MLASAIGGRRIDVAPAEAGEPAWSDGATVYIDADTSVRRQVEWVAVQAALVGAGSLDAARTLGRRTAVARRYLAVEGHRALAACEARLPPVAHALIDWSVAARSDEPEASLALATGRAVLPEPPAAFGTIFPSRIRNIDPSSVDARGLHEPGGSTRSDALRELDDGEADDAPALHLVSSPVGGGGAIGRLLKKLFGDARASGGGPLGVDAPTHSTRRGTRGGAFTTARATLAEAARGMTHSATTYPEWDVHRRAYRPGWCTVIETAPEVDNVVPLASYDASALRRPLARLGLELERRHRQLQGDDIDLDAAVEAHVEAAAGSAPDDAIFIDSQRCRRDLAVLLLLDISGSAAEPSAAGGTVHELQRTTAAALTTALHDLGDRVALYAFRSHGRTAVHVTAVKHFDDPLDSTMARRLGGLVPGAYTRLGAAIRHGTAVLERNGGTSRRLLVVLSDGFAYDHGYEGAYGEADARRALAEARRCGVGCLCLSIGASTDPDALRRVFGTAAHASIPRVEQLADVIGPLCRTALRSADVQRRVAQRRTRAHERLHLEGTAP